MNDQPTSGNRWENPADRPTREPDATAEVPASPEPVSTVRANERPSTPRGWRDRVTRPGMQLAGAALMVFLVGGGAGFAIGSTTGHEDRGDFPGDFRGNVPGGGFPGGRFRGDDGDGFGGLPGQQQGGQQPGQQPYQQQNDGTGA